MTIQFVNINSEQIHQNLIKSFENSLGGTLYQGDERRIFLEQEVPIIVAIYNAINDTGKQNLLRYARGEVLDAFGERRDVIRLQAQKSLVTLRFTLSSAQTSNVIVPIGTRATPDGKTYFATTKDLIISPGDIYGDVTAECTEAGERFNGLISGQINRIVDPVAFVSNVTNIDTSYGGADIEPDDDGVDIWTGYRGRIRDSVGKLSNAGPENSYKYWAKTADSNIQDIDVSSPTPGAIKITVLMKDGHLPTQEVLDKVLDTCSGKKVRPLTDNVSSAAPTTVPYNITLTYYISEDKASEEINIQEAIEGTGGAIEQYKLWQKSKLGRHINPDDLRKLILKAGAYKLDITEPVYTEVEKDAIAIDDIVAINYGGLL